MKPYVLSEGAELDLNDIWEYIAEDSLDAADMWVDKLYKAFESISDNPGIGHHRSDLTAYPLLFWPVGTYLVIYRATSLPTEIIAVTQGARDVPFFLRGRELL